jgi:transcriptional/translational regulatory protein YebC/TACO1
MGITEFEASEITFLPNETITIPEGEDKEKFRQLLDVLDELEDVQSVYHNVELD